MWFSTIQVLKLFWKKKLHVYERNQFTVNSFFYENHSLQPYYLNAEENEWHVALWMKNSNQWKKKKKTTRTKFTVRELLWIKKKFVTVVSRMPI